MTGVATWVVALALGFAAHADTLEGELTGLLDTHPQIRNKSMTVKANAEGTRSAKSGYLPTVKASGDAGPEYVDSPARRNTEGDAYYKGRESATLTITQKLFDGFSTDAAVDTARAQEALATADLRVARQTALLEGATAYIDVVRNTKLIALARINERNVQEQLNLEDERVRKGSGIASDVLAAKQRLQTAKERRVTYEGAFHTAAAKYTQVFGHAPDVAALNEPPLPLDLLPPALDEAIKITEKENPSVEYAGINIAVNREKKRTKEAGYYPTLDLVGKADYENDKNATLGVRRDASLLLTANWELFSGFKTDADVAQASWEHAAAKDNHLQVARKQVESVRTSWYKLDNARQRLDLLDTAATLAEAVWEAQKLKREAGKATVQDVLDEETRTNEARINYTNAYFDMYQTVYDLLGAMGRLEVENLHNASQAKPPVPPGTPTPAPRGQGTAPTPSPARLGNNPIAPPPARPPGPAGGNARGAAKAQTTAGLPLPRPTGPVGRTPAGSPEAMTKRVRELMQQPPSIPAAAQPVAMGPEDIGGLPDGSPQGLRR